MVHVRVRQQNSVDAREISHANARASRTPQKDETLGENRVDQDIDAGCLDEEG